FKIRGILNGTCNYILSQIEANAIPFATALREAQKLGFAEADPTEDIDGLDARAKLAILARVGLHCNVTPESVVARSISAIDSVDFEYASQLGCTIRQISWAELRPDLKATGKADHLFAAVQPALVELASPLARVEGSQNLVVATGRYGGETVFGGHGAGGNPTAVAVVSDILAVARSRYGEAVPVGPADEARPAVSADFIAKHYLRFLVKDRPGIIASLATILSQCGVNIDSVLQKPGSTKSHLPFLITLEEC